MVECPTKIRQRAEQIALRFVKSCGPGVITRGLRREILQASRHLERAGNVARSVERLA